MLRISLAVFGVLPTGGLTVFDGAGDAGGAGGVGAGVDDSFLTVSTLEKKDWRRWDSVSEGS